MPDQLASQGYAVNGSCRRIGRVEEGALRRHCAPEQIFDPCPGRIIQHGAHPVEFRDQPAHELPEERIIVECDPFGMLETWRQAAPGPLGPGDFERIDFFQT